MEAIKRIINLIYGLFLFVFILSIIFFEFSSSENYIYSKWFEIIRVFVIVSGLFLVINFSLFRKLTLWNKEK